MAHLSAFRILVLMPMRWQSSLRTVPPSALPLKGIENLNVQSRALSSNSSKRIGAIGGLAASP